MLAELGAALPQIQSVLATSELTWIVSFSDSIAIEVDVIEAEDRIGFEVALDAVLDKNRTTVLDTLMTYNLMWRETGGVRFGLAGESGRVHMIAEGFLPELSAQMLAGILVSLAEKAQEFTEGTQLQEDLSSSTEFMIRV
jgi:formate hydrogenlyase subunit 4